MDGHFFPEAIRALPHADIPFEGLSAYLSQSADHQIVFMHFAKDASVGEHSHAAQVGFVLQGRIELTAGGKTQVFQRGDMYSIPAGTPHAARIFAGYADITFFQEAQRYRRK